MREKPRYLRTAFLVGIAFMFITPIFSMVIIYAKADTLPEVLTGIVAYPQATTYQAWGGGVLNIAGGTKYDYSYIDMSNGGWNTNDWRFIINSDFTNISDYTGSLADHYSNLDDSYFPYYDITSMSDWTSSTRTSIANCTLVNAYAMVFGLAKVSDMHTANGTLTIAPNGTGDSTDHPWFDFPTWQSGVDDQWSMSAYYLPRNEWHIENAWENLGGAHPWINFTNYFEPAYSGILDEAIYLAAGGTDYAVYGEPWIASNVNPDYTGLYGHFWDISELVTLGQLTDPDFTVIWSQGEVTNEGRYVDYVGIWYKFTERTVYDYWISLSGGNLIVYGFVWLIMIFLPAMLLSQYVPKFGFIGGVTLMLVVMMISQTGFLPVLLIGMTNIAVIAFRGD